MSEVRQEDQFLAIKYLNETEKYPIIKLCNALNVARSTYYKWLRRTPSRRQQINKQVMEWIKQHYEETNGILGYRQMTITINREHEVHYNKKRIYRLMQLLHLKSVTRVKKKKYIPSMPEITAECTDCFWLFRRIFCFLCCLLDRGRVSFIAAREFFGVYS